MESVATYLADSRKKSGLTGVKLARLVGVSRTYLGQVENGQSVPSVRVCERFAYYLGLEKDVVLLLAGHVPPDVMALLQRFPLEGCAIIRSLRKAEVTREDLYESRNQ